jgi:uncharacterized protein YndB with AHSA1/START domain
MTNAPTTVDGTLELQGKQHVLRYVRHLDHPIETVWSAITSPDQLIGWWGDADVELVEGGRFLLRWLNTQEDGSGSILEATITELEAPRLLELKGLWGTGKPGDIVDWSSEWPKADVVLRWELEPEGQGTNLRFTSAGELPGPALTKTLAGWHWHLDALERSLAGEPVDLVNIEGWEPIHERYVAQLGASDKGR